MYRKEIVYDRETRDYAMYLDGELVGFARTYHEAEITIDQLVFDLMADGYFHSATELDGGSDPDQMATEPPPDDAPGGDDPETGPYARYTRAPEFDKRFNRGDPYAGDAWRDEFGLLRWVAVGSDPNINNPIRV